jgi:ubiquinone/menaquinone biosynthesis C-methylase UbiE
MDRNAFTEANRAAWDEAAPIHARQRLDELRSAVQQEEYCCLDATEQAILARVGLAGKAIAHLCCNNGVELLSIKKLGAARCVGFDISGEFIAQARELAALGHIDCEFVQSDVYQIPDAYDGTFDLIYISIGALGWMPDLPRFMQVIRRLLASAGWLFIYEMHPMLDMFDPDEDNPPLLKYSYFHTEPYVEEEGIDYVGGTTYQSKPMYWFHHKMSDIIQGCLDVGLTIEAFEELDHDISAVFRHFQAFEIKPAMSYTLLARLGR